MAQRKHITHFEALYETGEWVDFWLEEGAANELQYMRGQFVKHYGKELRMTDAGRTHEIQVQLHKEKPTLAAQPGYSWHEAGLAIDFDMGHVNAITGSQANTEWFFGMFGWKRTCGEEWHFQYIPVCDTFESVTEAILYIGNHD
jgi:hypothetical protein